MRLTFFVAGALALLGSITAGGCTAIVRTDSVQCKTDGDCASFGQAVCKENRCVEKPECETTDDCVAAFGYEYDPDNPATQGSVFATMAGFGVPVSSQVDQNAAGAAPFKKLKVPAKICARGACVPIRDNGDAQCANDDSGRQLVFGDPNTKNPVVVGFLGDITSHSGQREVLDPKYTQESEDIRAAALPIILARRTLPQFSDVLLIGCSQQRNPAGSAEAATRHLLALDAKAILGPTLSTTFEQAARLVADVVDDKGAVTKSGVPLLGPWILENSAAAVGGTKGLLFFPGPFASEVVAPLNQLLAERETALRASGAIANGEAMRVMVYFFSTAAATAADRPFLDGFGLTFDEYRALEPLLLQNLTFNGGAAASEQPAAYRTFSGAGSNDTKARFVSAALDFKPHVIIPFTGFFEWAPIVSDIEAKLLPRPTYVHPMVLFEEAYSTNAYFRSNTNGILSRTTGIRPTKSGAFLAFQQEFAKDFGVDPATLDFKLGLGRAYDASLLTLYSIYAARTQRGTSLLPPDQFTGRDVAAAMTSRVTVVDAQAVDANPASFSVGVSLLSNDKPLRLGGIQSTLTFDQVGHAPVSWETWCVDPNAKRNITNRSFGSGALGAAPSTVCGSYGL